MATSNTRRNTDALEDDLYITPRKALDAAFEVGLFDMYSVYYDPCDGLGDISEYLRLTNKCYASDLYDRVGKEQSDPYWLGERDFLSITRKDIPEDVECLVFNPPFTLTEKFVDKAHELELPLIMFNRLTTLESKERAKKFRDKWKATDVYVFGYRVTCDKGVNREPTANSVAYAWYVFDPRLPERTQTQLHWIV